MPRTARLVVGGCPYPIVRRGKNRGQVFFVDDDRRYYLKRLRRQTERFGLAVQAYCLMTKHLHVIATPRAQDSSGQRRRPDESVLHARRQRPSRPQRAPPAGPLLLQLAGRGVVLERADLRGAQSGPREAGAQGVAYPWSSAGAHGGGRDRTGLPDLSAWGKLPAPGVDWRESLSRPDEEEVVQRVRSWSYRSCPLGSERFIRKLERKLGRRLRPRRVGRPPQRAAARKK